MGTFGIWQWLVVGAIVLLLFARPGRISGIMGDFGKGLRSFKKGMKEEDSEEDDSMEVIEEAEEEDEAPKPIKKKKKRAKRKAKSKTKAKR